MYKCFGIHYFKIIHDENRYCMTKTGKGALFLSRPFEWEYRRTCLFILWMGCSNSFPEKILLFFSKSQPNKSSNKRNILIGPISVGFKKLERIMYSIDNLYRKGRIWRTKIGDKIHFWRKKTRPLILHFFIFMCP